MIDLNNFKDVYCPSCGKKITRRLVYRWDDYVRKPLIKELGKERKSMYKYKNIKVMSHYVDMYEMKVIFEILFKDRKYVAELKLKDLLDKGFEKVASDMDNNLFETDYFKVNDSIIEVGNA
jgi:hypothetical protein